MSSVDLGTIRLILTDERREKLKVLKVNQTTHSLEDIMKMCFKELQYAMGDTKGEDIGLFLLCETSENASKSRLESSHQLRDTDTIVLSRVTRPEAFLLPTGFQPTQPIFSLDRWWEPRVRKTDLATIAWVPTTLKLNIKRVVDVGHSIKFTVTVVQQCFPKHFMDRPFQLHLNHQGKNIPPDSTNYLKLTLNDGSEEYGLCAVYRFPVHVQVRRIWDHWPFVVSKAEISLQANSANRDGVTVRPTLNIIPKNLQQMCRFNVHETSTQWDFISNKPWVFIETQERQGAVENKRVQFTYFMSKTWVYDIVSILGPLMTITVVSFLNYFTHNPDYFEVQSSLIIAIAFVVPQVIAIRERGNTLYENDIYILLILFSYAMTMFPTVRVVRLIGNLILISSNIFPMIGYLRYARFVRSIRKELEAAPWSTVEERYTSDVELMKQSGYVNVDDPSSVFARQIAKAKKTTLDNPQATKKGRLHFPEHMERVLKHTRGRG